MRKPFIKPSLQELMNTKQTLSQLMSEGTELAYLIQKNGGELTPEIEQRLEVNSHSIMRKIDAYKSIEDQFEAQAALFKRKADCWNALAKTFSNEVEKLRSRIKYVMKEMGKDEIRGHDYRYSLGKSAGKLVIEDESRIPNEFKMVVQTTEIDREKLKAALINGFEVPGAHIEESGTLRVYENSGRD